VRPLDRRLLRYAVGVRGYLITLIVATAAVAGLVIAQAQLLASAIAGAFTSGLDLPEMRGTIAALAAVVAARAALAWAIEGLSYRASAGVKSRLRRRLLEHAMGLGPRWLATRRSGELATLATTGLDALDPYFGKYLPQLVLALVIPAAVASRLLAADPLSGVIIVVTLPLIPVFMALVGATTAERTRFRWRALAQLSYHFLDVVAGLQTLKVFGRAKVQADSIRDTTDSYRHATLATLRLTFLSSLVLELAATFSVALVAVSAGLRLASGHLGLRTGLLVLVLAPEAYLPLRQLASNYHASADGLAAASEVFDVLETQAPAAVSASAAAPAPVAVRIENVSVRYDERHALTPEGAWLKFGAGEVVALAGPSGSGKSTLIAVLLGFVTPDEGRVLIEEPNGERGLDELDMRAWRARVAWVPQHPVLRCGTVESNIRLGRPGATREAVARAARSAALREIGLDTPVGEGGSGLSAGQRRRVAVARALLADRPLLLLDEPTAGLDTAAEAEVLATVRGLAGEGRAVLMVAHRPAVLAAADRVVMLPRPAQTAKVPAGSAGSADSAGAPA
jgi:thiol reductant ABC exporter CydD subunit